MGGHGACFVKEEEWPNTAAFSSPYISKASTSVRPCTDVGNVAKSVSYHLIGSEF
jgi:hypothetical protein